ncbi:MFS transporter, SHS family, lactate transporter [Saprolegnia diclina VS20]|uniref:MFS transporter, SHS family, lactate transporter n=1 Tax=Saprolegnia diclina (strain VS20) TaxID=1156394 RepID=T0QLD2_SAPDV|nr:MFS transporter, SHS family, lactate transporter [Saprolegnia diclina VS20]EQC34615.1 MFS transporter, SHS family, lactate transporter [Saprolegnia diclina VS20]|eukprot:XP_008612021.1 MFS transporter, SHS family, lactate transporter [Saprolegnia diclina VS20]
MQPKMTATEYLGTRISSLKPPMAPVPNPIALLKTLDRLQWLNFGVGFAAWTWDAFDFFTVSMTLSDLAKEFHKTNTEITWGISVTLMLRPIGSVIFGIAADRYGRKWPFVINNILFIVLELATGFCTTFTQFMWVRAFYGVAMGGMWGMAAATALEDAPAAARGLISGIFQQGYSFGYLLAVVFARAFVNTTSHGWRPLFWFGACPPVLIILFRMMLPETKAFTERHLRRAEAASSTFVSEGKLVLQRQWVLLGYLVLLMTAMNFLSHGSQDLYPTMLKNTLSFSANEVTVTQVVANLGAIIGGTFMGYYSQVFGRRLSILACAVGAACVLYPYCFTTNHGITAAAFCMQFFVMGAWGVIPIHLMELSPPSYSTFIVGTSYQLGNLISATAATIEASLSEVYPLPQTQAGVERYDYAKVIAVLLAIVLGSLALLTFLGPEKRGQEFDHDETLDGPFVDDDDGDVEKPKM